MQNIGTKNMKTIVLTGGTSGIGLETAKLLAKQGHTVYIVSRDSQANRSVIQDIISLSGNPKVNFLACDLSDLNQVKKLAAALGKLPRIDVLINNAGVHMTTRQLTVDVNETAFAVNHLASFLITSLLLKRMIESAPSRIIQVNSEGHRFNGLDINDLNWEKRNYGGYGGYGASKTAQLMTVWELNDLLAGKGVTINAMHPGAVKSNIGTNNGKLYNWFSKFLIQPTLKNPEISGEAIYYLASSPEMNGVSGRFYNLTNEEIPAPHAQNRELGKKIFQRSKELVQLDKTDAYEV